MSRSTAYSLPALVGGQYVLSAVLSETADTILYSATQKDMRREVVVETLRCSPFSDHRLCCLRNLGADAWSCG
ncbi:MAG: hypothetical protein IJY72_04490 [Akkermansia sp.]|nr:hypothetical protein [Akkermansia sp.]